MSTTNSLDQEYKNIRLRMGNVHFEQGFKFAGLKLSDYPDFSNINTFHSKFEEELRKSCAVQPYTEVGYGGKYSDDKAWDYIFGCMVSSVEGLPEELAVFDTGVTDFVEIEFAAGSAEELVGGEDGPGVGMENAAEYIKTQWLPAHGDAVELADEENMLFAFYKDGVQYLAGMIEIYKTNIKTEPKMSFYIPMKKAE